MKYDFKSLAVLENLLNRDGRIVVNAFKRICRIVEESPKLNSNKLPEINLKNSSIVIFDRNGEVTPFLFTDNLEEWSYVASKSLKCSLLSMGILSYNSPVWGLCKSKIEKDNFLFNGIQYKILFISKLPKIVTDYTVKKVNMDSRKKEKAKRSFTRYVSGKKTKAKKSSGYIETAEEKKQRQRDFLTPIYQPIGLGKRR